MHAPERDMVSARTRTVGLVALLFLAESAPARAQAVEVFTGHQAVTADVMFFNYFKDRAGEPSPVLLFHRLRALVDYDIDTSSRTNLPQFGMTNALSYNPTAGAASHRWRPCRSRRAPSRRKLVFSTPACDRRPRYSAGSSPNRVRDRPSISSSSDATSIRSHRPSACSHNSSPSTGCRPTSTPRRCSPSVRGWASMSLDGKSAWAPMCGIPPARRLPRRRISGSSRGTHSDRATDALASAENNMRIAFIGDGNPVTELLPIVILTSSTEQRDRLNGDNLGANSDIASRSSSRTSSRPSDSLASTGCC